MTPHEFVRKWKDNELTERASAQEHFIDLCRLFDHPTPTEADKTGEEYAFEKGVTKTGGGDGFADVWKRGFFAWEYKKRKRSLDTALEQLTRYASALLNPPLHVACDTEHFRIVTAWTNTVPKTYTLSLEDLLDVDKRAILHAVFHDPEKLRPKQTRAALTREAADKFSTIAERLQHRYPDREAVAHFVNQLAFCFFAEDVKLLPQDYFTKLLKSAEKRPANAKAMLDQLFAAMETGGFHGVEDIARFNGGLFDGRRALELNHGELALLVALGSMEWDQIDPTIFGTLFERFLDPDKRAQIGAHYTDPDKIMMIVEPVVLRPLEAEWVAVKARITGLLNGSVKPPKSARTGRAIRPAEAAQGERDAFLDRLRSLRILDPACGSGNFLYLALHGVKDLENRAVLECEALGLQPTALLVGPEIVRGIEINPLAAELARTTIWIGYIQWKIKNGILAKDDPVLRKLDTIECRDALVSDVRDGDASISPLAGEMGGSPEGGVKERDEAGARHAQEGGEAGGTAPPSVLPDISPARGEIGRHRAPRFVEAEWPAAEFVVGNPPFLGGKLLRGGLGDAYVETLFAVYDRRVPREADLVTYWFEKAREAIASGRTQAAGLVSTNSIRGGANRKVLERLMADAAIFEAWSDEPWIVEGAAVRVSLVCFRGRDGETAIALVGEMGAPRQELGSPEGGNEGRRRWREAGADQGAGDGGTAPPSALPGISPSRGEIGQSPPLRLDGVPVAAIFSDLSAGGSDLTKAKRLRENAGTAFIGIQKTGPFDVDGSLARAWLPEPANPNGRPNSDVLHPYLNGLDLMRQSSGRWLIDFGDRVEGEAAYYQVPFDFALEYIKPFREKSAIHKARWWRLWRPRPEFFGALGDRFRYFATAEVSKHRVFAWLDSRVRPDKNLTVFARDDDTSFGILHSRFHEHWSLRLGTSLEDRPRYTPTTTFETFPFPEGLTPNISAEKYAADPRALRIAAAAKALDEKRRAWLNPADLVDIVPEIVPTAAPGEAPVNYPDRILPKNAEAALKLKKRTLTNLYNERPQWLAALHDDLDRAVAAAYGWPEDISTDDALARLLALNLERADAGR